MISSHFPTPYDVEQTFRYHNTSFDDLKRFLQSRGVFVVGNGKDHICEFATSIFFEHRDYLFLRDLAQGADIATNISGFIVRPRLMPVPIDDIREDFIALRRKFAKQEPEILRKGAPLQKLGMPVLQDGILRVQFEYQRVIPGRVELMHRVDSVVNFAIEEISGTEYRVVCYPQADQDVKRVEDLFKKLGEGTYSAFSISLDHFTKREKILFFDTILDHYYKHSEWKLKNVIEITIRQQQQDSQEADLVIVDGDEEVIALVGESDDEKPVPEDDLLSITQAVLQGKNLRTNSFVKKCERQGYYFPSMTLLLEHREKPEVIQVTIRFKLSPKMFEVILSGMSEKHDYGEVTTSFAPERQQAILREFWNKAHEVWRSISKTTPHPQTAKQLSFADNADPQ